MHAETLVLLVCVAAVVLACTPCSPVLDANTVIEAYGPLGVNVALIPDYGSCSVLNTGYSWSVNFGDGVIISGTYQALLQAQATHQYAVPGQYLVVAEYCSACDCNPCNGTCGPCAQISKVVQVPAVPQVAQPASCVPCQPLIDNATVIEPVVGYRGSAEVIPDYGSCGVLGTGYAWVVDWNDGTFSYGDLVHMNPYQALHQYAGPGVYTVTAYYCSSCNCGCSPTTGISCPLSSCSSTTQVIKVVE